MPRGIPNKPRTSEDAMLETRGEVATDQRDPNATARPKRIPMRQGLKLAISGYKFDRENFFYRFFYDDPQRPGRVTNAEAAYYEHCVDAQGAKISRPSGGGTQYLMRLPMEYHLEDVAAKTERNKRVRQEQVQLKSNEYAPTKAKAEGGQSSITDVSYTANPFA